MAGRHGTAASTGGAAERGVGGQARAQAVPGPLPDALRPDWPAPSTVVALMSTRAGGVSRAPFDSLNLWPSVLPGQDLDDPAAVMENQRRFATALGAQPVWLNQVHGADVVRLGAAHRCTDDRTLHGEGAQGVLPRADASISTEPGLACTVLVADCLPVLFCSQQGDVVGAAHAGWRGLAGGVLEATVAAMGAAAGRAPAELIAWLGPCIGPTAFEVGADVLAAFGVPAEARDLPAFRYAPRADGSPRWRADLPALARARLQAAGVAAVHGGQWCTFSDASRFFSFRREPRTGRLAAGIALRAG